jgi:hypothetical protein
MRSIGTAQAAAFTQAQNAVDAPLRSSGIIKKNIRRRRGYFRIYGDVDLIKLYWKTLSKLSMA